MVKKLGNYLRANIWVVILWIVVTVLTVVGTCSNSMAFIPDVVFVIVMVLATVMLVIDFVRFDCDKSYASRKYGMKIIYKPVKLKDVLDKYRDDLAKNPKALASIPEKWFEYIGSSVQYTLEENDTETFTDHDLVASVIFGLAYGKKATFEEFEAWYLALRDYIERPKVYRVEYGNFYDEIELTEIDQMPTKNLVILEARMGDEIVSKIMEITYSGSLYDPVEELAEYLKGMYEAAKDTTKY